MIDDAEIRASRPSDRAALEALYRAAFPEEDLVPLLGALLEAPPFVLSLVAAGHGAPVGHVALTWCSLAGQPRKVALLGPLAVAPGSQRQGIGGRLVRAGLRRVEDDGGAHVFVLGDPAYYGRFGFAADDAVAPPYRLPEAWRGAWQSVAFGTVDRPLRGTLSVPDPWRRPELWAP